jgi:hypothetical protein
VHGAGATGGDPLCKAGGIAGLFTMWECDQAGVGETRTNRKGPDV